MSKADIHANAWSDYWSNDFLTTFVDHQEDNYTGEIKQYWESVFAGLNKDQRLVDLAAGNGALLDLASRVDNIKNNAVMMTAIDLADITGSSFYQQNPNIELLSKTDITSIKLPDLYADYCISQFGFEYSQTSLACVEVARILKPQGHFHAVMHHVSSNVSLHSRSAIEQISLCRNSKLTETVEKLLRRLKMLNKNNRDVQNDAKATQLRDHFNAMATRLTEYGDKLPDSEHIKYFLNELGQLFGKQSEDLSIDQKLLIIAKLEIETESYHVRMKSMLEASMNEEQVQNLKTELEAAGLTVASLRVLQANQQDHAWVVEAVKQ